MDKPPPPDPCQLVRSLARSLAQRERPSAFRGSRIQFDAFELEVVEIGPYKDQDGTAVTFFARPMSNSSLRPGQILRTP